MATKVFISWSGDLSRKLGDALRDWLPSVLQFVRPYFSPEDIEKGAKWDSEISKELDDTSIGIVCLTADNTDKPWIIFEAGALSKSIEKSKVCTLLFNVDPSDIKGPLASFQATRFLKEDFKRLIVALNNSGGEARLDSNVLDSVFDMWWPQLESKIADILKSHKREPKEIKRTERDILEEVLGLVRLNTTKVAVRKIHPEAIKDLIAGIEKLQDYITIQGGDTREGALSIFQQIKMPMRYICSQMDMPSEFEKLRKVPANKSLAQALEMKLKENKEAAIE